jgi:hypothetical protein
MEKKHSKFGIWGILGNPAGDPSRVLSEYVKHLYFSTIFSTKIRHPHAAQNHVVMKCKC